jgi:hypothetical protein
VRTRFQPETPDPEQFVRSATIVPDTNVLLGLYRLSPSARNDALAALEAVAERLWLPHQVGLEFYRNLDEARGGLDDAYASARKSVEEARKAVAAFSEGRRHKDSREAMTALITPAVDALLVEIDRLRQNDPAIVDPENDEVQSRIEALFDGRVGLKPADDLIQRRVEHFIGYRVPNLIPPGFEDVKRKQQPLLAAGDYLLWCELLDHAEVDGGPVLLVSDDTKNDWYQRAHGKSEGPRQELVMEFARRSVGGYHQMTLARFVELAREVLDADVAKASVDEIEAIEDESVRDAASDERRQQLARTTSAIDALLALSKVPMGSVVMDAIAAQAKFPSSAVMDAVAAAAAAQAKFPSSAVMDAIAAAAASQAKFPMGSVVMDAIAAQAKFPSSAVMDAVAAAAASQAKFPMGSVVMDAIAALSKVPMGSVVMDAIAAQADPHLVSHISESGDQPLAKFEGHTSEAEVGEVSDVATDDDASDHEDPTPS